MKPLAAWTDKENTICEKTGLLFAKGSMATWHLDRERKKKKNVKSWSFSLEKEQASERAMKPLATLIEERKNNEMWKDRIEIWEKSEQVMRAQLN